MTVQGAAKLWQLSVHQVQKLSEGNRIENVVRLILKSAMKSADERFKDNKNKLAKSSELFA